MNAAHILTAATFAVATGSVFASDEVQRYPTPSTANRAEVQANVDVPARSARQVGEATVFVDRANGTGESRASVIAEARQSVRVNRFNPLFVGA